MNDDLMTLVELETRRSFYIHDLAVMMKAQQDFCNKCTNKYGMLSHSDYMDHITMVRMMDIHSSCIDLLDSQISKLKEGCDA